MEGTHLLLSLLLKRGHQVAQKKEGSDFSNTLGFTCHNDNVDWALRGNRPSVPFWSPRSINREFLEVQVSV
jgi:hypothetical protein